MGYLIFLRKSAFCYYLVDKTRFLIEISINVMWCANGIGYNVIISSSYHWISFESFYTILCLSLYFNYRTDIYKSNKKFRIPSFNVIAQASCVVNAAICNYIVKSFRTFSTHAFLQIRNRWIRRSMTPVNASIRLRDSTAVLARSVTHVPAGTSRIYGLYDLVMGSPMAAATTLCRNALCLASSFVFCDEELID
jgi:hypothetical protein